MRKVRKEGSRRSSRPLWLDPGHLSQTSPLVVQIISMVSLKRRVWQLSRLGMASVQKKV